MDNHLDLSGASWFKSSHSDNGGQCVEVSPDFATVVPVRDSKDPHGPALVFPSTAFTAFVTAVKAGAFVTA
ncbi:hypothetical protein GCM10009665_68850 [Kitasatospora nipponensis]|uniref:DUF397 domain-containing protein n=1 Tax=Kitasatospora nipponensis TaxID=258049 RepID=A0ABN1WXA6_9ACTN